MFRKSSYIPFLFPSPFECPKQPACVHYQVPSAKGVKVLTWNPIKTIKWEGIFGLVVLVREKNCARYIVKSCRVESTLTIGHYLLLQMPREITNALFMMFDSMKQNKRDILQYFTYNPVALSTGKDKKRQTYKISYEVCRKSIKHVFQNQP